MPTYQLANFTNSSGLEAPFIYITGQVATFPNLLLLFVYVITAGATFGFQDRRIGRANMAMASSVAGLITTTGAFVLFSFTGLVNLDAVIITLVVTIVSTIWFFFSDN